MLTSCTPIHLTLVCNISFLILHCYGTTGNHYSPDDVSLACGNGCTVLLKIKICTLGRGTHRAQEICSLPVCPIQKWNVEREPKHDCGDRHLFAYLKIGSLKIMQSMRINRFYKIPKRYRYEVESFKAINRQSRRWCRNINVYVKYSWCHSCWFVGGKDVAHNKGMNAWIKYIWMRKSSCYLTLIPWFPSIVSIDVPKLSVLDFFLRSNAEDFGGK